MEEEEYVTLNNLLTKYRVYCMKMYSDKKNSSKIRERNIKQVRHIDNLRRTIPLILN